MAAGRLAPGCATTPSTLTTTGSRSLGNGSEPEDTPHATRPGAQLDRPHPSLGRINASHAHTASPRLARPLARTHERNEYDFPVGLTILTSDIYSYIYISPYIYIHIYIYIYIGGWGVSPTGKSASFRSCVRASEAAWAREAVISCPLGLAEGRCSPGAFPATPPPP